MPTLEQIRAARALLGWSQHDLAERADLSQTGIARIENGTNQPNSKTIAKIEAAFDAADVEFIDNSGVKKRTGEVKILEGQDGARHFLNEMFEYAQKPDGEILLFNGTPSILAEVVGKEWLEMHVNRMLELTTNFKYNIIVKKGEQSLPASRYATYRFFPDNLFNEKTIHIFGNTVFFRNSDEKRFRLIRIEQTDLVASMRILFNIAWEKVAEN